MDRVDGCRLISLWSSVGKRSILAKATGLHLSRLFLFVLLSALLLAGCDRQDSADPGVAAVNWPLHGLTYQEQRFSPLREINEQTVTRLGLAWSLELGSKRGLEATPIVIDGVIYTTGAWSVVYAIDARSGKFLWTFDPQVPRSRARVLCCDAVNRGVAFDSGRVILDIQVEDDLDSNRGIHFYLHSYRK